MNNYNKIYKNYQSAWGNSPNFLVRKALKFINLKPKLDVLDLGCGQGRDMFFLSKKGLQVAGLDLSKIAIKQISEKAKNKNLLIETICSNVSNYKIKNNKYDIIIGIDILQFLKRKEVVNLIKNIKINLRVNGLVILSSFTTKDSSYRQSGKKNIQYHFKPKELKCYFNNFELLYYSERIVVDAGHAGTQYSHKHGIVEIIARKI